MTVADDARSDDEGETSDDEGETSDDEGETSDDTASDASGGEREASTLPDRTDADPGPTSTPAPQTFLRSVPRWAWLALPLVAIVVAFFVDRGLHGERVWRGVTVAARDLGGLDRAAAAEAVAALEGELRGRPIAVSVRGRDFALDPNKVGFQLDRDAMLEAVMQRCRTSIGEEARTWLAGIFGGTHPVDVVGSIDPALVEPLLAAWESEAVDDPPFEGGVKVIGGKAVADLPRRGHRIDRERSTEVLLEALRAPSASTVPLPLVEVAPQRKAAAVEAAVAVAEQVLAGTITLLAPRPDDAGTDAAEAPTRPARHDEEEDEATLRFRFEPATLAAALRSRLAEPDGIEIFLDPTALEDALKEARAALERAPVDARFEVLKRDKVSIVPSRPGRVIDAAKVAASLLAAAQSPQREGEFVVDVGAQPTFSTADAEALGIVGLVSKFTTTYGCCRPRVKNIHRIAELVDGVLVKPGETFSINELVGERTEARGFVPAPTIVRGKMKDTVGGGVSQFATTFFNAALRGGYEIVERQPHSIYFRRYPMGHEATLSFPKPDVIIKNDTEAGLLIKTEVGPTYVTVKFYGDNGGRKVERKVSDIFDVVDPPIEYIADPSLEPDEEKVKERGQKGWAVNVSRTVEFPDGHEKTESRKVTYNPRVRKIRVHPCKIPKGEDGYTGEPCPEKQEDEEETEGGTVVAGAPPEAAGAGSDAED